MQTVTNKADFTGLLGTLEVEGNSRVTVQMVDVDFMKTASPMVWADGQLTYTVTITHNETGEALKTVVFTDVLPITQIVYVANSAEATMGGVSVPVTANYDPATGLLTVNLPDIPEGETLTLTFRVEKA